MHTVSFEVRDSELDAQGVVNNANYFVYMEHARHKFAESVGLHFVEMAKAGQNLFLISSQIDFKQSLRSMDSFVIETILVLEGRVRFGFKQAVKRSDGTLVALGYNVCVCIDENNRRRPYIPEQVYKAIELNNE